jgi:hypothetical protein
VYNRVVGYRDQLAAINLKLGNALRAANADDTAEREACEEAVEALQAAAGNEEIKIAELLRDGDGEIDGAFDIADANDEEYARWARHLALCSDV